VQQSLPGRGDDEARRATVVPRADQPASIAHPADVPTDGRLLQVQRSRHFLLRRFLQPEDDDEDVHLLDRQPVRPQLAVVDAGDPSRKQPQPYRDAGAGDPRRFGTTDVRDGMPAL
jgi:hypothetical protein